MCGLAAYFEKDEFFSDVLIEQADKDLFHRGPDAGGSIIKKGFALVHRRLSIIDTSVSANQPMHSRDDTVSLVFNGEIYNYLALKEELISLGVSFTTSSDTEVVLEGYKFWGEDLFFKLEGMFGLVIVDEKLGIAIAARDHLGIKPLYMRKTNGPIGFASEIRPLMRLGRVSVDTAALGELLEFGWAAGTKSNLNEIELIDPGTYKKLSLNDGTIKSVQYFNILDTFSNQNQHQSFEQVTNEVEAMIEESVTDHLMSDVGFAVQLSGGVDSSLITSIVSKKMSNCGPLNSFGVDLGDYENDEKVYRREVTKSCVLNHHEVKMDGVTFANALPRAIRHMEGPVPHGGCVMLMSLCDEIKKTHKVVLAGEGADEFFGGYQRYSNWRKSEWQERIGKVIPASILPNVSPFKTIKKYNGKDIAVQSSVYVDNQVLQKIFPSLLPSSSHRQIVSSKFKDFRTRLFAIDQTAYLQSLLVRQDKMSMAASVETRVPFTHLPLAKLVNGISHNIRVPGEITKPILKKIALKHFSEKFVNRRKNGLLLPYEKWCDDPKALGRYLNLLTDSDSKLAAFSEGNSLKKTVDRFRSGSKPERRHMMKLINIELWLRELEVEQSVFDSSKVY